MGNIYFTGTFLNVSIRVYSLLRGVMRVPKTYSLYVMLNESNGIEIKCTEKFIKYWKERGFRVIAQLPISILL